METASRILTQLQDIRADIRRDIKLFTDPSEGLEDVSLDELSILILSLVNIDKKQEISSYGYRLVRDRGFGSLHIVERNEHDQYRLLRFYSRGGKWEATEDVQYGPVSEVLDYIMANWI